MAAAEQLITDNLDVWSSAVQTKSAAGRGKANKLELYGIKKLRELILELAVRGLLVPQDPTDEPASELLKKIAAEKAQLLKDGKIKKPRKIPALEDGDRAFDLPDGWEWVRFGEISQHNAGKTLDKRRNTGEPRDYLTTSNLYWGRFDLAGVRQMLIKEDELEKCTARQGDLLICEGGEAGRAAVWSEPREICFQNHIHRARFYGDLNPYYAYRYFELLTASGEIENYRKGVGISNMSGKALASIPFVLPPLAEQTRIIAKVDELMALCDQLEQQQETSITAHQTLVQTLLDALTTASERDGFTAAWARIADHFDALFTTEWSIDQLKQTILQLAVMGKLVPSIYSESEALEFQEIVSKEKQRIRESSKTNKTKILANADSLVRPAVKEGWEVSRINELVITAQGVQISKENQAADHRDGFKRYLYISDFKHSQNLKYVEDKYPKKEVAPEDLVMANTGSPGEVYYGVEGILSNNLFKLTFNREILSQDFLYLFFKSPWFIQILGSQLKGGAQQHLGHKLIGSQYLVVPPIKEQGSIVAKVREIWGQCDTLKSLVSNAQATQLQLADAAVFVKGGRA